MPKNKTGILLSGGMDSIALAYWKRPNYAFTLNYGQRAAISEIQAAKAVSDELAMEHFIINVDCSQLGSGDMHGKEPLSIAPVNEWWPYRNQLLVTLACMKAVSLGIDRIIVGSVKTDGTHKDGTQEFYSMLSDLIAYQEGNIAIEAPAIHMTTKELVYLARIPFSTLLWAHSCHKSNSPCMHCSGCLKYLHVLQELGIDE